MLAKTFGQCISGLDYEQEVATQQQNANSGIGNL